MICFSPLQGYCANVSRTFMVDALPKVEKTYSLLVALFNVCLEGCMYVCMLCMYVCDGTILYRKLTNILNLLLYCVPTAKANVKLT